MPVRLGRPAKGAECTAAKRPNSCQGRHRFELRANRGKVLGWEARPGPTAQRPVLGSRMEAGNGTVVGREDLSAWVLVSYTAALVPLGGLLDEAHLPAKEA